MQGVNTAQFNMIETDDLEYWFELSGLHTIPVPSQCPPPLGSAQISHPPPTAELSAYHWICEPALIWIPLGQFVPS